MNALIASNIPKQAHRAAAPLAEWAATDVADDGGIRLLRQSAQDSIDSIRSQLATSLVDSIDAGFDTSFSVDDLSPDERAKYKERIDSTLEVVRGARHLYESPAYERFIRLVSSHASDLAPALRQAQRDFVAYSRETERVLVLFGAGTDDDAADLDLIPDVA